MVSLFPSLFTWQEIAPFLVRLVLAAVLAHWSYRRLRNGAGAKDKITGIVDGVLAVMFLVGLWTQLAAIIFGIDLLRRIVMKIGKKMFLSDGVNYYLILLVLCITLLVSGAGWFSFDLKL